MALSKEKAEPLGWGGGMMVGEGGEVGGAGGRGSPPRTLHLTRLRCSVPWATQEVEQVGSVTGGVGWRWREALLYLRAWRLLPRLQS